MMVSVVSGMPQMTMKDDRATEVAEDAMRAESGAGRFTKNLYPKHLVTPIKTIQASLLADIKRIGMSTGVRAQFIVPSSLVPRAVECEQNRIRELAPAITAFKINWQQVLHTAAQQQGEMFDPSIYPDVSELDEKITLRLHFMPAPDIGQLGLIELAETIKQRAEVEQSNILAENARRLASDLSGAVGKLVDKLRRRIDLDESESKSRNGPRFHDSLMENLEQLVDTIPELNFTNDPRINDIVEQCRAKLRVPMEVLKSGTVTTKKRVLADAEYILSQMSGMY
jgi:hypothetical protein